MYWLCSHVNTNISQFLLILTVPYTLKRRLDAAFLANTSIVSLKFHYLILGLPNIFQKDANACNTTRTVVKISTAHSV